MEVATGVMDVEAGVHVEVAVKVVDVEVGMVD